MLIINAIFNFVIFAIQIMQGVNNVQWGTKYIKIFLVSRKEIVMKINFLTIVIRNVFKCVLMVLKIIFIYKIFKYISG